MPSAPAVVVPVWRRPTRRLAALEALPGVVRRHPRAAALAAYLGLSLATTAWRWLPNPTTSCACQGNDPTFFMWALRWWPYALTHGLNPLESHFVWYPIGANVARAASIPTAALALWPVTALFGPLVSYNVMSLASPTLAAFFTYLLCRHIVRRELPALAGGYLFGFGAYQFPQLVGHPNLSLVFLVPLMVLAAIRRAEGRMPRGAYIAALAAMLALQVGLSTEVLTTVTLMGAVMLLAALLLTRGEQRRRVDALAAETIAAGWIAVAVVSPFIYYALIKGGVPSEAIGDGYGLDLLNPVFPTITTWAGGSAFHALTAKFESGGFAEANGYLSLPIIIAFWLWATRTRRRLLARMLLVAAVVSFLAALGGHLHVAGIETIVLPYHAIENLPVLRQLTTSRIAVYTSLAVAVGIAAWLAESPPAPRAAARRWAVFALGAVMVFPNMGGELWSAPPAPPAFFRKGTWRHYLRPGEPVLALPYAQNGTSMGWQAECGFCFRMPEGYLGHSGASEITSQKVVGQLGANERADPGALRAFLVRYGIRAIVVDMSPRTPSPYAAQLSDLGLRGIVVGGVMLFRVPASGA
jgi:hypothetical protein